MATTIVTKDGRMHTLIDESTAFDLIEEYVGKELKEYFLNIMTAQAKELEELNDWAEGYEDGVHSVYCDVRNLAEEAEQLLNAPKLNKRALQSKVHGIYITVDSEL